MNRAILVGIGLAAALAAGVYLWTAQEPQPPVVSEQTAREELELTIERHFDAIDRRDLAALRSTLTSGADLTLILPNGARIENRQEFLQLHEEWFIDDGWRMEVERLDTVYSPELAVVSVRTTMLDDGPESGRQFFLTLTFARETDGWRLVFDQNTRIPGEG